MKKIAVITGASSGMGKEFVHQLLSTEQELEEVWLIARRKEVLQKIKEECESKYAGKRIRLLSLNLEEPQAWKAYEKKLEEERPNIRYLINAAGYGKIGKTKEIDVMEQTGMIRLNCEALEAMTQLSIPYMRKKSKILQVASASAFLPQPGFNVYAASKAFVLNYSRALGRELRKDQITVTVVCPGPVETEFFTRAEELHKTPSYKKKFRAKKENVVQKALKDAKKGKAVSVYGVPMKGMRMGAKLFPHGLLLKGFR